MTLARSILNANGQVLLAAGITLSEDYIRKLKRLNINHILINDDDFEGILIPEYLSLETQQKALSILSSTMQRMSSEGTFCTDAVSEIASEIVEELVAQKDITIHLSGISIHDNYTLAHSLNCSIYTALLARFSGFSISQMKVITCGALLHDMGKTEIDKKLLNKPGRLTTEEFTIIKNHPFQGFNLIKKRRLELSSLIAHMAWQHHEKLDGSGYPRGLYGKDILDYARLLSITDVYEAVTVHRPYRQAMTSEAAYQLISSGLGTNFDQKFGQIFLDKLTIYLSGMEVLLNTGDIAVVVSPLPNFPKRPLIRLMSYPDGTFYSPPKDVNLIDHPELFIVRATDNTQNDLPLNC